jgi:hypothetical protein
VEEDHLAPGEFGQLGDEVPDSGARWGGGGVDEITPLVGGRSRCQPETVGVLPVGRRRGVSVDLTVLSM